MPKCWTKSAPPRCADTARSKAFTTDPELSIRSPISVCSAGRQPSTLKFRVGEMTVVLRIHSLVPISPIDIRLLRLLLYLL